jgi:hypothetical protein
MSIDEKGKDHDKTSKGAPEWALSPFRECVSRLTDLGDIIEITTRGISTIRGIPRIQRILSDIEKDSEDSSDEEIERAERLADLAEKEVKSDFRLTHSHGLVSIWSNLENTFKDFIANWLKNSPDIFNNDLIKSLEVEVGLYESLDEEEKYLYLADLYEKETLARRSNGVNRFENILDPIGLSGPVPEKIKKNIYTMQQIRHCIVHRASIADKKLLDDCPYLDVDIGEKIPVSRSSFKYMFGSSMIYLTLIIRVQEDFGVDMKEDRNNINKNIDSIREI